MGSGKDGSARVSADDLSAHPSAERGQWTGFGETLDSSKNSQIIRPARRDGPVLIGIRGEWYDATNFVDRHPGGNIILEFQGKDATAHFLAYHDEAKVLRHWKSVGTYEWDEDRPGGDPLEGEYLRLVKTFTDAGYFVTSPAWFYTKVGIVAALFALAWAAALSYRSSGRVGYFITGFLSLGMCWHQMGFLFHDSIHHINTHKRSTDEMFGWIFGCCGLGVSAKWWRDEHVEHHLFTNTTIDKVAPGDPQMFETAWAQDKSLRQYFPDQKALNLVLKVQHLIYVPGCLIVGPFVIRIYSYLEEKSPTQIAGIAVYWAWTSALLSLFPTYFQGALFFICAFVLHSVLHIQLTISHYTKPWIEKEESKVSGSWMRRQATAVLDVDCPKWIDWFHGGLQFHAAHHIFPRLSRQYLREANAMVHAATKKHGVTIEHKTFFKATWSVLTHLRDVGIH